MLLVGALGVMLGALPLRPADAQLSSAWSGQRPVDGGRTALEAFYTRTEVDAGGRATRADGIGGRLMWALASESGESSLLPDAIARRAAVGVFGAYIPEARVSAHQFGLAADVTPFAPALDRRVEPFLSLGAGALHTAVGTSGLGLGPTVRPLPTRGTPAQAQVDAEERTSFLLVPSAGARVQVAPGVAFQGDVRRLVTFGDRRRHHTAFGTGLRLTF
jgi:hypothetical protein